VDERPLKWEAKPLWASRIHSSLAIFSALCRAGRFHGDATAQCRARVSASRSPLKQRPAPPGHYPNPPWSSREVVEPGAQRSSPTKAVSPLVASSLGHPTDARLTVTLVLWRNVPTSSTVFCEIDQGIRLAPRLFGPTRFDQVQDVDEHRAIAVLAPDELAFAPLLGPPVAPLRSGRTAQPSGNSALVLIAPTERRPCQSDRARSESRSIASPNPRAALAFETHLRAFARRLCSAAAAASFAKCRAAACSG
jgi:hypothetical protein